MSSEEYMGPAVSGQVAIFAAAHDLSIALQRILAAMPYSTGLFLLLAKRLRF
jgi:hypothetical protein